MTSWRGEDGLPYEDTTCLAHGFADDVWMGTSEGAIRHHDGRWDYFAGERWLPGNRVHAIAVGDRRVAVATEQGLGMLEFKPYTLAKQAAYYEQHLEITREIGDRRGEGQDLGNLGCAHWSLGDARTAIARLLSSPFA